MYVYTDKYFLAWKCEYISADITSETKLCQDITDLVPSLRYSKQAISEYN